MNKVSSCCPINVFVVFLDTEPFIRVFHEKHIILQRLNVNNTNFCESMGNSKKSSVLLRNKNKQIQFSQIFHNVMNMRNMMICAAKFITSSDQI